MPQNELASARNDDREPDDLVSPSAPATGGEWVDTAESTSSPSGLFDEKEAVDALGPCLWTAAAPRDQTVP